MKTLRQFSFRGMASCVIASWLPNPVIQGNEIRVNAKTSTRRVHDSAGNTYIELEPNKEWRAYNVIGGPLSITVEFETALRENEVKIEEWSEED